MTDQALQDALGNAQADEAGITAAMELLETQAQLRDIEKMEFSSWVMQMERIGSPEAMLAVENAHRAQKGLSPLASLAASAPLAPIEDVATHLNNLYASQVSSTPEEIQQVDDKPEPHEPTSEPYEDEFYRLLLADTVVGAEDELTALEEELDQAVPQRELEENFTVFEDDPGVVFAPVSAIEQVKLESAPRLNRRSRSSSQFWSWLGLSGSVLPLGLAWYASKSGVAFTQAVIAVFLGLLASALVVSVGALAGKRSGLPTLMLSRAAFGVYANAAPASVLTIARLFWSSVIAAAAIILAMDFLKIDSITEAVQLQSSNSIWLLSFVALLIGGAVALAIFGGGVLFRAQQTVGIIGSLAAVLLISFTVNNFSLQSLLSEPSSDWSSAFGISVLTFSVFGLAWTSAGADFARKLSTTTRGASVVGWAFLALVIVPAVVAAYGMALLGSSSVNEAGPISGFAAGSLFGDFSNVVDAWLGYFLLASGTLSAIVILAMSMYSSNLGLHSIGAKLLPGVGQPIIGALVFVLGFASISFLADPWAFFIEYALLFAIPVAAWAGIFISDVLIRRIAYHEISLSRGYGFYKSVNVVNLVGWFVAITVGLGFTYIQQPGFEWTGFLSDLFVNQEFWVTTSFGVVITFAFASLLPVFFGVPRIKKQEREVLAIESRRDDLKDIFDVAD